MIDEAERALGLTDEDLRLIASSGPRPFVLDKLQSNTGRSLYVTIPKTKLPASRPEPLTVKNVFEKEGVTK